MKRARTKERGVYERKSDVRKHNGKPDVCFDIAYRLDGKLIWEKAGWSSEGYTAKLASQIRSERTRSIRHGEELPKQKKKAPYFKDVAAKYLDWARDSKTREGKDDLYRYRSHLSVCFDDKRLNEISPFDLERLKTDLMKEGLAPATVKHCLILFRQVMNKAVLWGMYKGENPIKGVKMPTVQNQRQRFLSHEEADQLLTELSGTSRQLHDMTLLSLHCGLRSGEIFNIKGQDLDFENELINISDPKNKETRKAYMTRAVKEMLLEHVPVSPDEHIFKDRNGNKVNAVSKSFHEVIERLGLNEGITDRRQRITFHSLRHTFASWLALQGEPILTIKELLGHKSLAMTTKYAHLMPDQKRRATLNLEKAFNGKRNVITIQGGI
ncbi:MAG: site-specific integrase [Deltaproteobacteria bacterium]|nr:site-specific integrase [Deltaproteobacteria bacterium]